ncbi:MAG: metal-dependent hydrolase [Candidatus Hadarchaeales archaeon]
MRRSGHIGGALVFSTAVSVQLGLPQIYALLLCILSASVAMIPDEDIRLHSHRGFTHSVAFLILVSVSSGMASCALWAVLPQQLGLTEMPDFLGGITYPQVFLAGSIPVALGIGSHIFFDLMTSGGVALMWPRGKKYSMGFFSASNPLANYGLAALGFFLFAFFILGAPRV